MMKTIKIEFATKDGGATVANIEYNSFDELFDDIVMKANAFEKSWGSQQDFLEKWSGHWRVEVYVPSQAGYSNSALNDIQKEIDQRWPFESDHDNLVKAGQNEINENTKARIRTIIRRTIAETSLPRPKSRRRHRSEVQGFENINENMLSFGIATAGAAGSLAHAWDEGQRLASEREALPARWKKDYGLETDPYLKAANGNKRAAAADREDDEKWIRAWAMKSGLTFEKGKAPNELSDSSFKNLSNKQLYILMQRLRKPGIARRIKKMFGDNYVDPKEEYPAFGDF
jgi:hypothetical protein